MNNLLFLIHADRKTGKLASVAAKVYTEAPAAFITRFKKFEFDVRRF
jgi:hypothetical protein